MNTAGAVTSLHEVEAAARAGTLGELIDTLRSDPWSRWLATALRVDLAAVVADPALTLQTVWARGYFTQALRGTLHRWRAEHAGRPWARALRPPVHPLSGPLDEEYRGDFRTADAVEITDGSIVVSYPDGRVTTLDRATGTGRTVPGPAPAGPAWTLDRNAGWGRCRVVDRVTGAAVVDLRINDEDSYRALAATGDAVFAAGWCYDYDGVVVRVDVATGTPRWRWEESGADIDAVSCTADGSRVLAFSDDQVFVLDGATGAVVHRGPVAAVTGALDPAGTRLVTVTHSAVRVWSLDRLDAGRGALPGSDSGFAYAMWSPDGSRLLTGSALCDGTGGRLIAALPMDGTGYLEGGPPPGARAVGAAEVVEFSPLRGANVWDAFSGAPIVVDPSRRYSLHRDRLWIAPDARRYVHAERRGEPAVLRRVHDGEPLAPLADGRVGAVAWAPDSSRFATGHEDGTLRIWAADGTPGHTVGPVDGGVAGLAFSVDGSVLASGGRAPSLCLWDTGSGRLLGETPRAGHDLGGNLQRLHGLHGFRARRHPYRAEHRAGYLVLEPDDPHLPGYRIACDHPLVPDPTGTRWASPAAHVALEPGPATG